MQQQIITYNRTVCTSIYDDICIVAGLSCNRSGCMSILRSSSFFAPLFSIHFGPSVCRVLRYPLATWVSISRHFMYIGALCAAKAFVYCISIPHLIIII